MKLFSDLQQSQAVQLDNGLFVVALGTRTYEIAGVRTQVGYGREQVIVESLDSIKRVVTVEGEILHYTSSRNGVIEIISVAERNLLASKVSALTEAYYNEDADELIFPDLDQEFEYKKLEAMLNSYVAVRADSVTTLEPEKITVVGTAVDTGSQFIETPFQFGNVGFGGRGAFRVNLSAIALDEFNRAKLVYTEATFNNTTHSNIRYAQVNGSYVFNDHVLGAKEGQVRIFGSLEQAKAMEKEVRDGISNILRHKLAPVAMTQNVLTVNNVMAALEEIRSNVNRIDPKTKSYNDHARAMKQLSELVAKLMKV